GRQLHGRARRVRRDPGPERLGQVDPGPAALDAAAARRRQRDGVRTRRVPRDTRRAPTRQPRLRRGQLLQEDVAGGEPRVRSAVLRHDAEGDGRGDSGDPREGRLPDRGAGRADGEPVARDAAEGGARTGAADLARAAAARRADDGARSAVEARGAGVHPRGPRRARRNDPALHARPRRGRGARGADRRPRPGRAALPRACRRAAPPLRRVDARRGVLRRNGPPARRRGGRRGQGGVRMTAAALRFRHELIGLGGVVERNWYLVKRYAWWEIAFFAWTVANSLTIVFISKGIHAPPALQNELATKLLIGGVIWAYLGIIFEILTETVSWERWEGTIEYTFMAPLSR